MQTVPCLFICMYVHIPCCTSTPRSRHFTPLIGSISRWSEIHVPKRTHLHTDELEPVALLTVMWKCHCTLAHKSASAALTQTAFTLIDFCLTRQPMPFLQVTSGRPVSHLLFSSVCHFYSYLTSALEY